MLAMYCMHIQIYPSLLPGRQFPNLASVYPLPTTGRPASWEHYSGLVVKRY